MTDATITGISIVTAALAPSLVAYFSARSTRAAARKDAQSQQETAERTTTAQNAKLTEIKGTTDTIHQLTNSAAQTAADKETASEAKIEDLTKQVANLTSIIIARAADPKEHTS